MRQGHFGVLNKLLPTAPMLGSDIRNRGIGVNDGREGTWPSLDRLICLPGPRAVPSEYPFAGREC